VFAKTGEGLGFVKVVTISQPIGYPRRGAEGRGARQAQGVQGEDADQRDLALPERGEARDSAAQVVDAAELRGGTGGGAHHGQRKGARCMGAYVRCFSYRNDGCLALPGPVLVSQLELVQQI
jgi:hypothetical protein